MKKGACLLALAVVSAALLRAEEASVYLFCASVRLLPAESSGFRLELTADAQASEVNNELRPLFDPTLPSHGADFRLVDPAFPEPMTGQIAIDLPPFTDQNQNGFDDFFEVAQAVEAVRSAGLFSSPVEDGTVTATWSRGAGQATGTCVLQLTGRTFGQLPEFVHSFELLAYAGQLAYTPGTNSVTGTLQLTQSGGLSNTLSGAIMFTPDATNRANHFVLPGSSWTNSAGGAFTYGAFPVDRDEGLATNYFGFLTVEDGDPATSMVDFIDWVLSIDDPNDTDGDLIPDLTDDPFAPPAEPPELSLGRAAGQLLFTIESERGRTFELEEVSSVTETNWTMTLSGTLTNEVHTISWPVPSEPLRFWRVSVR
jgi:hypothetical protein